jgi:CspA family cold shock protein
VKSFDPDTGEGVVVSEGGCQAALSWDALDDAGYDEVEPGDALIYEVALVGGMLIVTQIYEIAGEPVDADEDDEEEADGRDPIKNPPRRAIRLSGLQIQRLLSKCGPASNPVRRLRDLKAEHGPWRGMARVDWFDPVKGYGFVTVDDETVLLHRSMLAPFGRETVEVGAALDCDVITRPKGRQVARVHALVNEPDAGSGTEVAGGPADTGAKAGLRTATCKWFSRPKGYGFLALDDGGDDIFVHMEALRRCGLRELRMGQRVRVRWSEGERGCAATDIEPDDGD